MPDAETTQIRRKLLAYAEVQKIGVGNLARRISEADCNEMIGIKTLQRFLKGETDAPRALDSYKRFLESIPRSAEH